MAQLPQTKMMRALYMNAENRRHQDFSNTLLDYLKEIKLPNKAIEAAGKISQLFLNQNITTLWQAIEYVQKLPYGRNTDRTNYSQVLTEKRGACSTKHALIAALAKEMGIALNLTLVIFLLNSSNTPKIAPILEGYHLTAVPEAHCYLTYNNKVLDVTFPDSKEFLFYSNVEEEFIITPEQIGLFKLEKHQTFIKKWIKSNTDLNFELIWNIREQCIQKLSQIYK
jgi:hypothetical protein